MTPRKPSDPQASTLVWRTRALQNPRFQDVEEARRAVVGAQVPIVGIQTPRGSLEAFFGANVTLLAWWQVGAPVLSSVRSDFTLDEAVATLAAFVNENSSWPDTIEWRTVLAPLEERAEVEQLRRRIEPQVGRLWALEGDMESGERAWVVRGVARQLARDGMGLLARAGAAGEGLAASEVLLHDTQLLILALLEEGLASSESGEQILKKALLGRLAGRSLEGGAQSDPIKK